MTNMNAASIDRMIHVPRFVLYMLPFRLIHRRGNKHQKIYVSKHPINLNGWVYTLRGGSVAT